jgi:hypothetical protein
MDPMPALRWNFSGFAPHFPAGRKARRGYSVLANSPRDSGGAKGWSSRPGAGLRIPRRRSVMRKNRSERKGRRRRDTPQAYSNLCGITRNCSADPRIGGLRHFLRPALPFPRAGLRRYDLWFSQLKSRRPQRRRSALRSLL